MSLSKHRMIIVQNTFDDEKKLNPYAFQIIQFQKDRAKEAVLIDDHNLPTDWNKCNFFYINSKVIFQIRLLTFFFVFSNSLYSFITKPWDWLLMGSLWVYNLSVFSLLM